jgi:acyl carrier protein
MKKVMQLVLNVVKEVGEDQEKAELIEATEDTRLFGENLDSMGVVFLVTDLEAAISDEFDVDLILADERAMSQKSSPFRTVKTLAKYVSLLILEEQQGQ